MQITIAPYADGARTVSATFVHDGVITNHPAIDSAADAPPVAIETASKAK